MRIGKDRRGERKRGEKRERKVVVGGGGGRVDGAVVEELFREVEWELARVRAYVERVGQLEEDRRAVGVLANNALVFGGEERMRRALLAVLSVVRPQDVDPVSLEPRR